MTSTPSTVPPPPDADGTTTIDHTNIKRSKPLKYAYEKEIVLYAHHKNLDYFSTECIYSPEAFRGSARALIKNLERVRPSAILDVVRSGEDMAKLVPGKDGDKACGGTGCGSVTQALPDEDEGGCGSAQGRGSGGDMAKMERTLAQNDMAASAGLETEVTLASVGAGSNKKNRKSKDQGRGALAHKQASKRLPQQTMGKCAKCGYISSQTVCKACTLLEGLNKSRPKTTIGLSATEDGGEKTVRESMKDVSIAAE